MSEAPEDFGHSEELEEKCQHTDTKERVVFNSKGGVKKITICEECGKVVNKK